MWWSHQLNASQRKKGLRQHGSTSHFADNSCSHFMVVGTMSPSKSCVIDTFMCSILLTIFLIRVLSSSAKHLHSYFIAFEFNISFNRLNIILWFFFKKNSFTMKGIYFIVIIELFSWILSSHWCRSLGHAIKKGSLYTCGWWPWFCWSYLYYYSLILRASISLSTRWDQDHPCLKAIVNTK